MTEEAETPNAPDSPSERAVNKRVKDVSGRGKWDARTGRYIPISGGSRTRIPVHDEPGIPRYQGVVGIDPGQRGGIQTIAALYSHLGGMPVVQSGKAPKFLSEVMERKPKIVDDGLSEL